MTVKLDLKYPRFLPRHYHCSIRQQTTAPRFSCVPPLDMLYIRRCDILLRPDPHSDTSQTREPLLQNDPRTCPTRRVPSDNMLRFLFSIVALSVFASLAAARPGIWYRSDGTYAVVGSMSFTCSRFYLGVYGPERTPCGSCKCGKDRPFIVKRNVKVKFDHTLSTVDVNGVTYDIPFEDERYGCGSNHVKAYRFGCNGPREVVSLEEDYVCQESPCD